MYIIGGSVVQITNSEWVSWDNISRDTIIRDAKIAYPQVAWMEVLKQSQ